LGDDAAASVRSECETDTDVFVLMRRFASARSGSNCHGSNDLTNERTYSMKALVYHGPGKRAWEEVPDAIIQDPTDAVVRVDAVTICGTDLHILGGDVPEVAAGRILGHEAVGTVTAIGSGVQRLAVGDRVLVSCITSCGSCRFCRDGSYGQCLGGGGWILGHLIDGTQAEYVRVPFADNSTHAVPDGVTDDEMIMLADILPTSYEVGVLNGTVRPADVVVIVGAGPIGLAAILTSRLFSPSHIVSIDRADSRLEAARKFGADVVIDSGTEDPEVVVAKLTGGLGADVTMEAVGTPHTFDLAVRMVRAGGHVANIGVHGAPATLHLEDIWIKNLTITTGLVDTYSAPTLIGLVASHQLDTSPMITHRFKLDEFETAYDVFSRPNETGALKVLLTASR
jgi:alcohol dehydrogenase